MGLRNTRESARKYCDKVSKSCQPVNASPLITDTVPGCQSAMSSQGVPQNGHGDVTVVIDVGSRYFRGGVAGQDGPTCEITTTTSEKGESPTDDSVVDRGCVRDWERVEGLLHTVYSCLHVQPASPHCLLLTRHVHGPATDAERFVQVGLEKLGASAVYLGVQPVLTLYANGGTDGVVLDCGEGVTQVVPIYQGYGVDHAVRRQDLAGKDVSSALQSLLSSRTPDTVHVDLETAREMKERLCYVSPTSDTEAEVAKTKGSRSYTLPNGDSISVSEERFRGPEVLFQPSLFGSECLGLPALLRKVGDGVPHRHPELHVRADHHGWRHYQDARYLPASAEGGVGPGPQEPGEGGGGGGETTQRLAGRLRAGFPPFLPPNGRQPAGVSGTRGRHSAEKVSVDVTGFHSFRFRQRT
ncbi:actin-like [Babylonia areolata]|uniref:actin-like n=1 Tax=Babylonia areolata TaxID=304850 RepID=UPI003FCF0DF6